MVGPDHRHPGGRNALDSLLVGSLRFPPGASGHQEVPAITADWLPGWSSHVRMGAYADAPTAKKGTGRGSPHGEAALTVSTLDVDTPLAHYQPNAAHNRRLDRRRTETHERMGSVVLARCHTTIAAARVRHECSARECARGSLVILPTRCLASMTARTKPIGSICPLTTLSRRD